MSSETEPVSRRSGQRGLLLILAVFAAGIALIGWGYEFNSYRTTPLRFVLRPGGTVVPFNVDIGGKYEIELELSRGTIDEETLLRASEAKPGDPLFVDLQWQLLGAGALLKGGSTRDDVVTYGGETIGRTFASLDGVPGLRYALRVDTRRIPEILLPARPAMHVQFAPRQAMNRMATSVMAIVLGILLALTSIGLGLRQHFAR